MISLLTSLKPFKGDAIRLQENALSNWRRLDPAIEIIVYGAGEGISERASRFGAKHVPNIRGNAKGIPDFAAIVEHATVNARYDIQVYLNGDILLPPDFYNQVKKVPFEHFLLGGKRIDLAKEADFNHLACEWQQEIKRCSAAGQAQLQDPPGLDYFVFPRGLWRGLAPLIIGRGGYDNALIAYCLRKRIPIVDATWTVHVVHQWHDYSHVKGACETFEGADALANRQLHDIQHSTPNIDDADWQLIDGKVVRYAEIYNPFRRLELRIRYHWGLKYVSYLFRAISRIAWLAGYLRPRVVPLDLVVRERTGQSAG